MDATAATIVEEPVKLAPRDTPSTANERFIRTLGCRAVSKYVTKRKGPVIFIHRA
jgi:hypothetical protein